MKLSIIITSYKFKDYIEQCIDSILSQITNFKTEIIVRDDGSNDGTIELLQDKYKEKIKLLDSRENLGAVKNLITLLSECSGEYVAHLDGDDYLIDNNYYQRAIDFLDNNKEFSIYSGGYKYIEDDNIYPIHNWLISNKKIADRKDLLIENYISFARVFRKFKVNEEIFKDIVYPDWAFNFECLRYGKSYSETEKYIGLYRIHSGGMFSKKENSEKSDNKEKIIEILKNRYYENNKIITILDCFLYNQSIKDKLINFVNWLYEDKHNICLISNTSVNEEIQKKLKFFIYDSRNQLFKGEYTNLPYLDTYKTFSNNLEIHDIGFNLQKHGLSVLINLFNVLKFAKEQGYTHFQRFEVDSLFGQHSREFVKNIPLECKSKNKKGLFYYNHNNFPPDVSFHYFYCEIEYFLNKIKNIKCEQDYIDYLYEFYGNKDFKIVETFIYDCLKKNNDNEILQKTGTEMYSDFPDVIWNTESSDSNLDPKYKGCVTKLYQNKVFSKEKNNFIFNGDFTILSHSHVDRTVERKIVVLFDNNNEIEIEHKTFCVGYWQIHNLPSNIKLISVYENNKLLYTETKENCISYVVYK